MFTIHQVRLGLATNSSSTHSLILIPGGTEDCDAHGDFGWGHFTAASAKSKNLYAALQLRTAMERVAGQDVARAVAENWTDTKLADTDSYSEYVDHQSLWTLPLDWSGKSVDRKFFDELRTFLMREDVVVLGGNDNDECDHPLDDGSSFKLGILYDNISDFVCRKDDGYWILFNRNTGTKIRMSFGENGKGIKPEKALAPELVDVKITDFCPFNCKFCYQDSTENGKHADRDFLNQLAYAFREIRVFEVAIGGGEPTLHPDFVDILSTFRRNGIVPNFTTKSISWLNDHPKRQEILKVAGAFAYSVGSAADVVLLADLRDRYGIPARQINAQYVMGTSDMVEFEQILKTAVEKKLRLTLLGYKTNGRGDQFEPKDYSDWPTILKTVNEETKGCVQIGIDTALARDYQGQLADLGVPKWCYEVEEGKFSMYVDAVTSKVARSSYGESLAMRPLEHTGSYGARPLKGEILEHFARY